MKITRDENHKVQWHFTKKELVALLSHMSGDIARTSQCGLALDAAHGRAYATDGHRAIVCEYRAIVCQGDAYRAEPDVLVRRDTIERATALPGSEDIVLTIGDGNVTCVRGGVQFAESLSSQSPISLVHANFQPNTTGERCSAQGFNGEYLADLGNVVKACPVVVKKNAKGKNEKSVPHVAIAYGATELDPWIATIESPTNETRWTIYLMPCQL